MSNPDDNQGRRGLFRRNRSEEPVASTPPTDSAASSTETNQAQRAAEADRKTSRRPGLRRKTATDGSWSSDAWEDGWDDDWSDRSSRAGVRPAADPRPAEVDAWLASSDDQLGDVTRDIARKWTGNKQPAPPNAAITWADDVPAPPNRAFVNDPFADDAIDSLTSSAVEVNGDNWGTPASEGDWNAALQDSEDPVVFDERIPSAAPTSSPVDVGSTWDDLEPAPVENTPASTLSEHRVSEASNQDPVIPEAVVPEEVVPEAPVLPKPVLSEHSVLETSIQDPFVPKAVVPEAFGLPDEVAPVAVVSPEPPETPAATVNETVVDSEIANQLMQSEPTQLWDINEKDVAADLQTGTEPDFDFTGSTTNPEAERVEAGHPREDEKTGEVVERRAENGPTENEAVKNGTSENPANGGPEIQTPSQVAPLLEPSPAMVEPSPAMVEPSPAMVEPNAAVVEPSPAEEPPALDPAPIDQAIEPSGTQLSGDGVPNLQQAALKPLLAEQAEIQHDAAGFESASPETVSNTIPAATAGIIERDEFLDSLYEELDDDDVPAERKSTRFSPDQVPSADSFPAQNIVKPSAFEDVPDDARSVDHKPKAVEHQALEPKAVEHKAVEHLALEPDVFRFESAVGDAVGEPALASVVPKDPNADFDFAPDRPVYQPESDAPVSPIATQANNSVPPDRAKAASKNEADDLFPPTKADRFATALDQLDDDQTEPSDLHEPTTKKGFLRGRKNRTNRPPEVASMTEEPANESVKPSDNGAKTPIAPRAFGAPEDRSALPAEGMVGLDDDHHDDYDEYDNDLESFEGYPEEVYFSPKLTTLLSRAGFLLVALATIRMLVLVGVAVKDGAQDSQGTQDVFHRIGSAFADLGIAHGLMLTVGIAMAAAPALLGDPYLDDQSRPIGSSFGIGLVSAIFGVFGGFAAARLAMRANDIAELSNPGLSSATKWAKLAMNLVATAGVSLVAVMAAIRALAGDNEKEIH
jgi:hypothetical protein